MVRTHLIIGLMGCLAVAGCTRSVSSIVPSAPPRALPSTPATPVTSAELEPLGGQPGSAPLENEPLTSPIVPENQPQQVAELQQPSEHPLGQPAEPITLEAMAGSWEVPTDNPSCRIILAITQWSGGYRAATRRCRSAEIQSVNAWDVKDLQVVLVDGTGNTVARLYASGGGRYDGRTTGGEAISFIR